MIQTRLNRKFGFITGGACLVLFFDQIIFRHRTLYYLGGAGSALVLLALLKPAILSPVKVVWDKIGMVLGTINTWLILFLVFFLMVTPLGLLLRLVKRNLIALKWGKDKKTYWQTVNIAETGSLEQQF